MARWVKLFREGRMAFRKVPYRTTPHGEQHSSTLASLLDADCRWTAHELAAEVKSMSQNCATHCVRYSGLPQTCSALGTREISKVQKWHHYAVTQVLLDRYQREGDDFLGWIVTMEEIWVRSYEPNLKCQSNEWKHPGSPHPNKVHPTQCAVKVMFIVAFDIDGVILQQCCTYKADGKPCLLLHIPAAPPSFNNQEKMMALGGTEPYPSWQCKESHHCCCHGPLALLAIGDSGTSTVLTRYESM